MTNKFASFVGALTLVIVFSGCATPLRPDQARVTFLSVPAGATITINAATYEAPKTWTFDITEVKHYVNAKALWVSGASMTVRLNLASGTSTAYTFQRPNVPGIDADVQWAIHTQQKSDAEKQSRQQAFVDALRNYRESKITIPQSAPRQFIDCTSTRSGTSTVNTSCY